jgi:hypothetical protein
MKFKLFQLNIKIASFRGNKYWGVHLGQKLSRKIRKLGLAIGFNEDGNIRLFDSRILISLSFLPKEEVVDG